jgi:hypothetical protein
MIQAMKKGFRAVPIEEVEMTLSQRVSELRDLIDQNKLDLTEMSLENTDEESPQALDRNKNATLEDVLAEQDEDYAYLRRERKNIQKQIETLNAQDKRANKAMIEVLRFQEETAITLENTRYEELRLEREKMESAAIRFAETKKHFNMIEEHRIMLREEREELMKEHEKMLILQKKLERKKREGWSVIYILIGITLLNWIDQQTRNIRLKMRERTTCMMAQRPLFKQGGSMFNRPTASAVMGARRLSCAFQNIPQEMAASGYFRRVAQGS